MKITIGISPCPNDTFIFDAIYNKRIDLKGIDFEFILEDVEYLNKAAIAGDIALTKMSYFAYSKVTNDYQILNSGGALGSNCGPLLIANKGGYIPHGGSKVAIPGFNTTANFLLSMAYPDLQMKTEVLFSDIEDLVKKGEFDLGLIIHESRFTYQSRGLFKVRDLGEYWEEVTHSPIPLGCIVIKRSLDHDLKKTIDGIVHDSVQYAFDHPSVSQSFIKSHSQSLSDDVIAAHIGLYVNDYSLDLGIKGKQGVLTFFDQLHSQGYIQEYNKQLFVD